MERMRNGFRSNWGEREKKQAGRERRRQEMGGGLTNQYWHQKRSMWASLGRASTVLKHSNAGIA
jgi:hypothetical protein